MGLTKITKNELNIWKTRYRDSISDQENETKHCTLFYRELKEFVNYIEERNQIDEEKKIGCVRIYFVRPSREFQSDATTMKFVYNPLFIKKENPEGEPYPQMRIAMVPVYGERSAPSEPAILRDYSENDKDFMCLYPGTALGKEEWKNELEKRNNTRKLNKMMRKMNELKPDEDVISQIQQMTAEVEEKENKEAGILQKIVESQDLIPDQIKELEVKLQSVDTDIQQKAVDQIISEVENSEVESLASVGKGYEAISVNEKVQPKTVNGTKSEIKNLSSRREELKFKLRSKDKNVRKKIRDELIVEFSNFKVEHFHNAIKEPGHPGEHTGLCPPGGCQ